MSVKSLDKVSSSYPCEQLQQPIALAAGPRVIASTSSKASMRRMKAEESMAISLKEASVPKILGEVDFSQRNHIDTNIQVNTGPGVYYNSYYDHSWLMHFNGASFIKAELNVAKDSTKTYTLDLNHLSSLVNGKPLAKITIEVNDEVVVRGHNPNCGGYIHEQFDITNFLKDGKNEIKIKFDADSRSNYWINHLTVLEK